MCAEAVCVSDASSIAPHELRTQYSAEHQRQRCRRDARPCWESGEGPCHGWGPTVPFVPVTPPATAREAEALGVLVFTTTLSQREAARGAFITAAGGPRPWHTHVSRLSRAPARARVPALGRPVRILPGLACFPPPCLSCCRGAGGRWSLQAARLWGAALPLALVAPVVCRPGHVRHGGALCVAGRSKLWLARERSKCKFHTGDLNSRCVFRCFLFLCWCCSAARVRARVRARARACHLLCTQVVSSAPEELLSAPLCAAGLAGVARWLRPSRARARIESKYSTRRRDYLGTVL